MYLLTSATPKWSVQTSKQTNKLGGICSNSTHVLLSSFGVLPHFCASRLDNLDILLPAEAERSAQCRVVHRQLERGVCELGEGGRLDGGGLRVGEMEVQDVELAVAHGLEEADEEGHRQEVARRLSHSLL